MKPHTHQYSSEDEQEDNSHEYLGDHGMGDAAMRAMFAKQRTAISGNSARTGKLGGGGPGRFQARASESVLHTPTPKQAKSPLTGKASNPLAAPDVKHFTTTPSAPAKTSTKGAKAPTTKSSSGKKGKGKGHSGHEGHSPLDALSKLGKAATEAGKGTAKGAVAGTGMEPVQGDMAKSMKGHKYGSEDGRHDDR